MLEITFLGTGTSNGIPIIGCDCPVCRSDDPRDVRTRTSAVVSWDGLTLLIDTSAELRLQAMRNDVRDLDAVLFTHAHADHVGGIDDLRRFNELCQRRIPAYANPQTAASLRERYAYAFTDDFPFFGGKPDLTLHEVERSFSIGDKEIVPIHVEHGRSRVTGYRFGTLAYVTDAKAIPDEAMEQLSGSRVLVLNALRERPHPTHLNIAEALGVIERVQPERAYLVHLSHELGHAAAESLLPPHVRVAYDGLRVCVEP